MQQALIICQRELRSLFESALAFIFILMFLILAGIATFYFGAFYEREQAELSLFFSFHPWLYLFLIPAISMRLWAEERRLGTIETLLTLPVKLWSAVLGKFFAAWIFGGIALLLTFPVWLTANYLGNPDNGAILTSYLCSWLMIGTYLSIGSCLSAATSNQVIAFITTTVICFLFVTAGSALVLDWFNHWAPSWMLSTIASLSVTAHFESMSKGVIALRDVFYFLIMIVGWLLATVLVIERKKSST